MYTRGVIRCMEENFKNSPISRRRVQKVSIASKTKSWKILVEKFMLYRLDRPYAKMERPNFQ